jgi:hypothetical protein
VLFGAEAWTLRKVDQKSQESFEKWCEQEMITWADGVINEYYIKLRRKES